MTKPGDTERPALPLPRHIMTVDVEDWYTSSIDLFAEAACDHGRAPEPSVVRNTLRCLELFALHGSHVLYPDDGR